MRSYQSLIMVVASAVSLLITTPGEAGNFSVKVMNPDGTVNKTDPVTINVYDANKVLRTTAKSDSYGVAVFSATSLLADVTLRFEFTRASTPGGINLAVDGIYGNFPTGTKTIDFVIPSVLGYTSMPEHHPVSPVVVVGANCCECSPPACRRRVLFGRRCR